jgi:hypothetical protein
MRGPGSLRVSLVSFRGHGEECGGDDHCQKRRGENEIVNHCVVLLCKRYVRF